MYQDPPQVAFAVSKSESRHRLAAGAVVHAKSVLSGLHHEYSLAPSASDRHGNAADLYVANICARQSAGVSHFRCHFVRLNLAC